MRKILVATDFGKRSSIAINMAAKWAQKLQDKLILLHIDETTPQILGLSGYGYMVEEEHQVKLGQNTRIMEKFERQLKTSEVPIENVEMVVRMGRAEEKTYQFIRERIDELDMLFLGEREERQPHFPFLGGFNERMIQISPIPVVIIKEKCQTPPVNILLACDFSEMNEKALEWVVQLGTSFNSRIHLLHFFRMGLDEYMSEEMADPGLAQSMEEYCYRPQKKVLEEKLERMRDKVFSKGLLCDIKLEVSLNGSIEKRLNEVMDGWNIDLLVLGKRSALKSSSIGSTALKLGRHSSKSLAVFNYP